MTSLISLLYSDIWQLRCFFPQKMATMVDNCMAIICPKNMQLIQMINWKQRNFFPSIWSSVIFQNSVTKKNYHIMKQVYIDTYVYWSSPIVAFQPQCKSSYRLIILEEFTRIDKDKKRTGKINKTKKFIFVRINENSVKEIMRFFPSQLPSPK